MTPVTAGHRSRTVAHMFNILDAWRHLPNYRLEGRLAPFFELFLHDVLGESLGMELHPVIVPEFPLRKGTLYPGKKFQKPNQSYNVDYVAFSKDLQTAILVELKADMSSIVPDQETYLHDARNMGLGEFVHGIVEICEATDYESKYVHLLRRLANLELVQVRETEKLHQAALSHSKPAWRDALESVSVVPTVDGGLKYTRVIYIQPRQPDEPEEDFEYVSFDDVADIVQRCGDFGCIFANYLRQWTEDPGRQPPRMAVDRS